MSNQTNRKEGRVRHISRNIKPLEIKEPFVKQVKHTWINDIEQVIKTLPKQFSLSDVYKHTSTLQKKHPENKNIHAKIRQSLQILRDRNIIEFLPEKGHYRKVF